ncbi:MAG: amidohydrolase [Chloroflexi bacterium]|nr:amidohydrolase [Chloroflexota bacterium]
MPIQVHADVAELKEELIAIRRDLHRHPELAFAEHRTAGIVAERLRSLGFKVQTGVAQTGVVGIIDFGRPGKTLMLRADMDALPIQEIEGRAYGSTFPGKMHACGHDGHTSVSLVVASILAKNRSQLKGRLKMVFQPAEEIVAGAKAMLDAGVMKDPAPDRILGFHCWPTLEAGKVGVHPGFMWASVDHVRISIKGVGGHGGTPHLTVDPVVAGASLILALENLLAREVSPFASAALSFGIFRAGTMYNVIPAEAELQGSARALDPEVREFLVRRVQEVATGVASGLRCLAEAEVVRGTPAVWNDPTVCDSVREAATAAARADNVVDPGQATVGDDMAYFLQQAPGCYFLLGVGNPQKGIGSPLHSPEFDIDEVALPIAAETMARAAVQFLS